MNNWRVKGLRKYLFQSKLYFYLVLMSFFRIMTKIREVLSINKFSSLCRTDYSRTLLTTCRNLYLPYRQTKIWALCTINRPIREHILYKFCFYLFINLFILGTLSFFVLILKKFIWSETLISLDRKSLFFY